MIRLTTRLTIVILNFFGNLFDRAARALKKEARGFERYAERIEAEWLTQRDLEKRLRDDTHNADECL